MTDAKPRKPWLDLLRGLALLMVIYGHQVGGRYGYFLLTSPVKIPLFFAITGYVFNESRAPRDFVATLIRRLVVPWLGLGLLLSACRIPVEGLSAFGDSLMAFVRGEAAWYIPCCVVAELIWYTVRRTCPSLPKTALAAAACYAAGALLSLNRLLDAWMINRALVAQVYLLIGLIYRVYADGLKRRAPAVLAAAAALYAALAFASAKLYPGSIMDVHLNRYYSVPLCLGMIASGCLALMLLFDRYVYRAPRWAAFFGRNTLVIYLLHNYSVGLPKRLVRLAGLDAQNPWLLLAATLAVCAGYALAAALVNRFAPALAGKRRAADAR